jgi:predicted DNA-binding protein with PD1-like motif
VIAIEVHNAELLASITKQAAEAGIANGAIVSLIGAADRFTLSTMPADNAREDVLTDYDVPAEMSGSGEIVNGAVHIHATMAIHGNQAISGHLHRADIGTWFARVYIIDSSAENTSAEEWWTTEEVAAHIGVQPGTVSSYVARQQMPQPERHRGRIRFWRAETIIGWHNARPRRPATAMDTNT